MANDGWVFAIFLKLQFIVKKYFIFVRKFSNSYCMFIFLYDIIITEEE